MTYPTIAPTSRSYEGGDWPVKTFRTQNGSEVRMLYGNRRVGHRLSLGYENITDSTAEEFMQHYYEQQGTYRTFVFAPNTIETIGRGWSGSSDFFQAGLGVQWRYAGPPTITQVRPGLSSITVEFIGVGVG